jgi:Ca2+-binding RTX toxin-like protein
MSVSIRPVFVTDKRGVLGRATKNYGIEEDFTFTRVEFDFANQIYAGIGLSVVGTNAGKIRNANVKFPLQIETGKVIDGVPDDDSILVVMQGADANPLTVDVFYVQGIERFRFPLGDEEGEITGLTIAWSDERRDILAALDVDFAKLAQGIVLSHITGDFVKDANGIVEQDANGNPIRRTELPISPDVFAHELGHYLLSTASGKHHEHAITTVKDGGAHVNAAVQRWRRNLLGTPGRELPDGPYYRDSSVLRSWVQETINGVKRDRTLTKLGDNDVAKSAPLRVGPVHGVIGGYSLLDAEIKTFTKIGGVWTAAPTNILQPEAFHRSDVVVRKSTEDVASWGDRVDFYWLEDNEATEKIIGADTGNVAQSEFRDYLVFEMNEAEWLRGPVASQAIPQGKWLDDVAVRFKDRAFDNDNGYFNYVDVVSNIARYADNDFDADTVSWQPKSAALDYRVMFCDSEEPGMNCHGTPNGWRSGELYAEFSEGWTKNSKADDFVARWKAKAKYDSAGKPVAYPAKKVMILPNHSDGRSDGNLQIDAIIAGKVVRNVKSTGVRTNYGGPFTIPVHEYYVDYTITNEDNPQDLGGSFTVSLYGSYDGVTPAVLLGSTTASASASGTATFGALSPSSFEGFASIISVIDPDREQMESIYEDNTSSLDIVNTGYGVEIGAVDGVLTSPKGFESADGFFHAINGGNGTPSLFRINPSTLATTTLTFVGTGVSGTRDWQDLATAYDGSINHLYIADIGTSTSNMRVLKTPVPDGTSCTNNQIVLNAAWPLSQCEYEIIELDYPTGHGTPDARTLLVDPYGGSFYVVTYSDAKVYAGSGGTMAMVSDLPFTNVVGGDLPTFLFGGEAVFLKTDSKIYKFPFRNLDDTLEDVFDSYEYWEIPYASQPAEDLALDPDGNGFYMIRSSADGSGDFPIWHSQSSAPGAIISDVTFAANGEQWTLDYALSGDAEPFEISVYRVEVGEPLSPANKVGHRNVIGDDLLEGPQSVTIALSSFTDIDDEYGLVAMIGNKRFQFAGGAFRSASNTLYAFGSEESDQILVEPDGSDILVRINGQEFPYDLSEVTGIQARGRAGNDQISISIDDKTALVLGGAGNDVVDGSLSQATLDGGDGDDVLVAGSAVPALWGYGGNDTYQFTTTSNRIVSIRDYQGTDTLDFSRVASPIVMDLTGSSVQTVVAATNYRIDFNPINGIIDFDNVIGSDGADIITGNFLYNILSGGLGADTYRFVDVSQMMLGQDTIDEFADTDVDTLDFSGLTATLLGSTGIAVNLSTYEQQNVIGSTGAILKLTLTNPLGIDNVIGTSLADSIIGNDGENVFTGAGGNDTLEGGLGNDTYLYAGTSLGDDTIIEADAVDVDTLDFSALALTAGGYGASIDLLLGEGGLGVHGSLVVPGAGGIENVIGSTGNDYIVGNARPNRIEGGLGHDMLYGDRGDDVYVFARSSGQDLGLDEIHEFGGIDHDTLDFSGANESRLEIDLSVATDQDVLFEYDGSWLVKGKLRLESTGYGSGTTIEGVIGTNGNDLIVGNNRPNRLEGRGGNDTLDGFDGQDSLGGGDDTYVFARVDNESLGEDEIREASYSGYDSLDFSGMNVPVTVNLSTVNQYQLVAFDGVTEILKIRVPQHQQVSMPGVDSIEHVIGSPYDDMIRGNTLANHLRGGLGDDIIEGRGGNDILDGGEGSDEYEFLYTTSMGGLGDDILREDEAVDSDSLDFSAFHQVIAINLATGASAYGVLSVAFNRGDGVENVFGTPYADTISGNARANLLVGGAGNDTINGLEAEDTLEGGEGNDSLTGGAGSDLYRFPRSTSQILGSDSIVEAANLDSDTVDFSEFLVSGSTGVHVELGIAYSYPVYTGVLALMYSAPTSVENVIGSPANDSIEGTGGNNILEGRGGHDMLSGYAGNDTYVFSRTDVDNLGSDTITDGGGNLDNIDLSEIDIAVNVTDVYGTVAGKFEYTVSEAEMIDVVIGGEFNDQLTGSNVWLIGGPGDDVLTGNGQNDTLEGGEGDDSLIGKQGNDVYLFRRPSFEDLGVDRVFEELNHGTDLLDFSGFDESLFIDLALQSQQRIADRALELILLRENGTTRSDVENVIGTEFDDLLSGNDLVNYLRGGFGSDTLEGREGNDSLEGGFGSDTYIFDQSDTEDLGDDAISEVANRDFDLLDFSGFSSRVSVNLAATNSNNVDPDFSDLSLHFVGGANSIEGIIGTRFNDSLTGNERSNWLEGGEGNDTLSGGLGSDTYVFRVFGEDYLGDDRIAFEPQYGGFDILDFSDFWPEQGGIVGLNLSLTTQVAQVVHAQLSIVLETTGVASEIEGIVGSRFSDSATGNALGNLFIGNEGNDTFSGGDGSDTFAGGEGNDSLTGEAGADMYSFDRTDVDDLGEDVINEVANVDNDTLDFRGFGAPIDLRLGTTAQQVVHEDYLKLTLSHAAGLEYVNGTPHDDRLEGNSRDNYFVGDYGDDVYVFARNTAIDNLGNDWIQDIAGVDTVDFSGFQQGARALLGPNVQGFNQFQVNHEDGSSELTLYVPAGSGMAIENAIGSAGHDILQSGPGGKLEGREGNDTLTATGDDVTLEGGAGHDVFWAENFRATLEGGTGNDTLYGETGDTTYVFARDATNVDLGTDVLIGEGEAEGGDTFDFSEFEGNVQVNLNGGTAINVGGGKLYLTFGGQWVENVIGTDGDDTITGNARPNILAGGGGNDVMTGGAGDDTLFGNEGNDSLTGGENDDVLDGGVGNDSLTGSSGNDSFAFLQEEGADLGQDTLSEGTTDGTDDALVFTDFGSGVVLHLGIASTLQYVSPGALNLVFANANTIERIEGSPFDDEFWAGTTTSAIYGHAGNDVLIGYEATGVSLFGGAGDDALAAATGSTTLYGGSGNDFLFGGDSIDLLYGESGDDMLDGAGDSVDGGLGYDYVNSSYDSDPSVGGTLDPTSTALLLNPDDEVERGAELVLSLATVGDLDGLVLNALFYWDADDDGVLNLEFDRLVGSQEIHSANASVEAAISTAGMPLGDARFFAHVTDNHGLVSQTYAAIVQVIDAPPRVEAVYISSTQWSDAYSEALANGVLGVQGSDLGVQIFSGSGQLTTISWVNIDRVRIKFTKDVVVGQNDLGVYGINTANYTTAIIAFDYDPSTFTATWTFATPFTVDKLLLDLSDSVTDLIGNHLDGEWTNPSPSGGSNFPSGNGTPGGDFRFRINVLPGDIILANSVSIVDVNFLSWRRGSVLGGPSYTIRYDLNGDGVIDQVDWQLVSAANPSALPNGEPSAP